MPFDTTAMLFLFALFAGSLAASLSAALLYFNGSITTPGVFRIFGRVRFLQHACNALKSGLSHAQGPSLCSILYSGYGTESELRLSVMHCNCYHGCLICPYSTSYRDCGAVQLIKGAQMLPTVHL